MLKGYKKQSSIVQEPLKRLIDSYIKRGISCVIEGVHISSQLYREILAYHPKTVCFLIYISKQEKHMDRFAVRSKDGTVNPETNKYIKNFKSIRLIQKFLMKKADKHLIP